MSGGGYGYGGYGPQQMNLPYPGQLGYRQQSYGPQGGYPGASYGSIGWSPQSQAQSYAGQPPYYQPQYPSLYGGYFNQMSQAMAGPQYQSVGNPYTYQNSNPYNYIYSAYAGQYPQAAQAAGTPWAPQSNGTYGAPPSPQMPAPYAGQAISQQVPQQYLS